MDLFPRLRLGCAAPYRLAKRRLRDPDLDKHLALLMEHQNERAADPDHAKRCSDAVELICGTDEEIPAPLVKSCLGLLRINAMGVGGGRGRALFPVFSFLSHSCANNCRHVSEYDADMGHFKVRLYAQVSLTSTEFSLCWYVGLRNSTIIYLTGNSLSMGMIQLEMCLIPTRYLSRRATS